MITSRIPAATAELLIGVPLQFRNLIYQTAAGMNPYVKFPFHEIKLIRGTRPHPPHTDRQEVRNSITLQFNGAPEGPIVAHLFNDGTIKTSREMHDENNRRAAEETRLITEENKFPALQQTAARKQAEARMMSRIYAVSDNSSLSIIQKQLEKDGAQQEYRFFLLRQADARAAVAADAREN
ncbi:hypothetical protein McanMca71_000515 [Microsporum canis]|uniref:Uncharacterized protein n=1 Tax=Arthroderma otae (strain ATCC MYA-4605 / CBS 113480) TaxID=554155 RepID=C5FKK3_ARTOC|nr:uncharacterized protein MCYG_03044 [Microsporum canis CBS 113480]EEQ30225.1 predicted protein [Microsporum canis CBS 113480]